MRKLKFICLLSVMAAGALLISCSCRGGKKDVELLDTEEQTENGEATGENNDEAVENQEAESGQNYTDVKEEVWEAYGNRDIRIAPDKTISQPALMQSRENCFIVMSKKDYYLYVYEAQGSDTVLLARYDCCFARRKGQKEKSGDMRTPHCTMDNPFSISEIVDASGWTHDFGDGRGEILSYGNYFHRLVTPGHKGIGIHGSTNNAESVPGRASEGCIRLRDADLNDLHDNYTFVGMKVIIKAEDVDDYPFEKEAMERQLIVRKRHLNPASALTNEQVENATDIHRAQQTESVQSKTQTVQEEEGDFIRENLTLEELNARKGK